MRVSTQMQYQSKVQMEESKVYKEFMKKQAVGKTESKDKDSKVKTEAVSLGENLEITQEDGKMVVSQENTDSKSVRLKEYDIKSEIGKQLVDIYNKKSLDSETENTIADDLTKLNSSIKSMSLTDYL